MATPNNPRKFSEKIALHVQKQAEETAAFDQVMKELSSTRHARLQIQNTTYLQLGPNRGLYYGGSLPNVNQIGNGSIDLPFQNSGLDPNRSTRHHGLVDRVYRDRSRITSPHQKPLSFDKHGRQNDHMESCPYGSVYLSPPPDTSWRRTNSDSALHQSTLTPAQQLSFIGGSQDFQQKRVFLLSVPGSDAVKQDDDDDDDDDDDEDENWDCNTSLSKSKSCKVPGISIFPSPDQHLNMKASSHTGGGSLPDQHLNMKASSHTGGGSLPDQHLNMKASSHTGGGSLPDLTNIQFPPPLNTPLDTDDGAASFNSLITGASLGMNSSQPTLTLQDNMVPLILNTGDSSSHQQQNLQLSPTSPPLSLSQAAINAMNLEQQLSQYAFFNQQPMSQALQNQQDTGLVQMPSLVDSADQSVQSNMNIDLNMATSLHQYRSRIGSSANQSPTSPVSNQGFSPGGSPQHNSILGSGFIDFYEQQLPSIQASVLSQQLEQFNMMETPIGGDGLYDHTSTLNYSQALMMGLTGHCNLQTSQQMGYGTHGNIPNIILTVSGESPPTLPKDLSDSLSTDISFDVDSQFPLDDLKIDPLTLDGLHMLNDPDMVLADPATEDAFRLDRL